MKIFIIPSKNVLFIFIVVAYIFNLAIIFKQKNDKTILIEEKDNLTKEIEHNKKRIFFLKETIDLYSLFDDIQLPNNLQLINEHGEAIMLQSLLTERDLRVFRVSENHCISCIQLFNEIINSKLELSHENLICISDYNTKKKLTFYKNMLNLKMPIYICNDLNIPIEKEEKPYFFLLDKELKIHQLFFPLYSESENSEKYIQMINSKSSNIE